MVETGFLDDAELVVVAVRHAGPLRPLRGRPAPRAEGLPDRLRPPDHPLAVPDRRVAAGCRARPGASPSTSSTTGQMIDDVRLAVLGRAPVEFIGGLSFDSSGFGIRPDSTSTPLGRASATRSPPDDE